ncbi:amino acid permease [Paenibacillus aurantiacus]|uniref:Amino acid permease n=1 Tax=Paenibacillus aurantiacus TaxID=1936118 RepID=A0ABV5KYZ9_9BACL
MLAVIVGSSLFLFVCASALLLGYLAHRHAAGSFHHQSAHDNSARVSFIADRHDQNRSGHTQQPIRRMSGFSVFGFSFSGMGLISCACWLLLPAIGHGGPAALGIGWPVIGLFAMLASCVYASSAAGVPSNGGVYHWVLATSGRRRGLLAGGFHCAGQAVLYAVTNVLAASWLHSTLSEAFGYNATPAGHYALLTVLFAAQFWTSVRSPARLGRLYAAAAWMEIAAILIMIMGLAYAAGAGYWPVQMIYGQHHPVDVQAAGPNATSTMLGLLLLYRGLIGSERAGGMAEETEDSRLNTPWAIFLSTVYAIIFGYLFFAFLLVQIPFSPDAGGLLEGIRAILGDGYAWLTPSVAVLVFLFTWFSGAGSLTGMARMWYAMAQDRGVPMSDWFRIVSRHRRVPLRAHAAFVTVCAVISAVVLLVYGRNAAVTLPFQPLLLAIMLLHAALVIVAGGRCAARLAGRTIAIGPWGLGRLEPWIEWLTVGWAVTCIGSSAMLVTPVGWIAIGTALLLILLIVYGSRQVGFGTSRDSRR